MEVPFIQFAAVNGWCFCMDSWNISSRRHLWKSFCGSSSIIKI